VSATGQEGSASPATTFQTADNSSLTAATLNPPTIAAGWNVYLGLTVSTLMLQNSAPLAIGATFTLPGSGLVGGAVPSDGQAADMFVTGGRILRRG